MKLPYFIYEQYASMCIADCTLLWLRNACLSHCPGSLVDWIVHRTDERIGNPSFIEPGCGGVQFNKNGRILKRGLAIFLRLFQNKSGSCRFPYPRRTVNYHMLGIRPT